ncbi:MAG: M48 family metallopeptidase [Spirochaetaceae bacterium]|jgi:predicted metal-dependent hydrolase|nr:M48 family metallopeptidase [Spirochaetaceae bacterium]
MKMNRTIHLNGREIKYELARKSVKNINLRIRPDCSVYVSANNRVAESAIEDFLAKKAGLILSAIDKYAETVKYAAIDHQYVTGESFRYLGKDLRLSVVQGKNGVTSDGVYLALSTAGVNDSKLKANLINKWYDARRKAVFAEIVNELYPVFRKYGVAFPKLVLRVMKSRWGSCQPGRNIITLNKRLIETPRNAIEYVVMHEFVHFLHANHSNRFYQMLSALMPDWKDRKKLLDHLAWSRGGDGV